MTKKEKLELTIKLKTAALGMEVESGKFRRAMKAWWEDDNDGYEAVDNIDTLPLSVNLKGRMDDLLDDLEILLRSVHGELNTTFSENQE